MQSLGTKLDERVNEIADAVGDLGELRLLVAAGISLLDELDAASTGADAAAKADLENKVADLEAKTADIIRDAAERIGALASRVEGAA